MSRGSSVARLRLHAGDLVEVRNQEEIFGTLDRSGALDGLLFMPEMLSYCGKRFRVANRADKTCDTVKSSGLRRMTDTVHLEGTRCGGEAHSGCEAACQIFWKEAWLRRIPEPGGREARGEGRWETSGIHSRGGTGGCIEADLHAATRRGGVGEGETIYRCQATDLREASASLRWWSPMQYIRDVSSGNAGVGEVARAVLWVVARYLREHVRGYRLQVWLFNSVQRLTRGTQLTGLSGQSPRTPVMKLGLVPGELVQVKSVAEIRETLDSNQRNRGLYFDVEMTPFCGRTFAVRSRVSRIIDDKSGRLIDIPGDCVILEGAACTGQYHGCCPRAIYPYWREIWLRRVPDSQAPNRDRA